MTGLKKRDYEKKIQVDGESYTLEIYMGGIKNHKVESMHVLGFDKWPLTFHGIYPGGFSPSEPLTEEKIVSFCEEVASKRIKSLKDLIV
jgi:hypothetical protein